MGLKQSTYSIINPIESEAKKGLKIVYLENGNKLEFMESFGVSEEQIDEIKFYVNKEDFKSGIYDISGKEFFIKKTNSGDFVVLSEDLQNAEKIVEKIGKLREKYVKYAKEVENFTKKYNNELLNILGSNQELSSKEKLDNKKEQLNNDVVELVEEIKKIKKEELMQDLIENLGKVINQTINIDEIIVNEKELETPKEELETPKEEVKNPKKEVETPEEEAETTEELNEQQKLEEDKKTIDEAIKNKSDKVELNIFYRQMNDGDNELYLENVKKLIGNDFIFEKKEGLGKYIFRKYIEEETIQKEDQKAEKEYVNKESELIEQRIKLFQEGKLSTTFYMNSLKIIFNPITEEIFDDFVKNGNVSDEVINYLIATEKKIKKGSYEHAMISAPEIIKKIEKIKNKKLKEEEAENPKKEAETTEEEAETTEEEKETSKEEKKAKKEPEINEEEKNPETPEENKEELDSKTKEDLKNIRMILRGLETGERKGWPFLKRTILTLNNSYENGENEQIKEMLNEMGFVYLGFINGKNLYKEKVREKIKSLEVKGFLSSFKNKALSFLPKTKVKGEKFNLKLEGVGKLKLLFDRKGYLKEKTYGYENVKDIVGKVNDKLKEVYDRFIAGKEVELDFGNILDGIENKKEFVNVLIKQFLLTKKTVGVKNSILNNFKKQISDFKIGEKFRKEAVGNFVE